MSDTLLIWCLHAVSLKQDHYTLGYIIVTCMGVPMTKITGSSSDDWIHWHFGYNFS
jgi:hypothetical protein